MDTDGAQKLRPWLGDPSWITGQNPPARLHTGFVSYNDNLYVYGGTTDYRGDGIQVSMFGFRVEILVLKQPS
jgi:hypothetical protein